MSLTASAVAGELDRTAGFLRDHGDNTARVVHDLALGASHSSDGPGQRNAISDPTGNTATAPPDPLAQLEQRWWNALHALLSTCFDVLGGNTPTEPHQQATALAAHLRARTVDKPTLSRLHRLSVEIDHVIYECVPTDREQAEEELREERYLRAAASHCDACETPLLPGESRGGHCDGCRKRETRWHQLHIDAGGVLDRQAFKQWIVGDIAAGIIRRPASPYSPARQIIHEEDASA